MKRLETSRICWFWHLVCSMRWRWDARATGIPISGSCSISSTLLHGAIKSCTCCRMNFAYSKWSSTSDNSTTPGKPSKKFWKLTHMYFQRNLYQNIYFQAFMDKWWLGVLNMDRVEIKKALPWYRWLTTWTTAASTSPMRWFACHCTAKSSKTTTIIKTLILHPIIPRFSKPRAGQIKKLTKNRYILLAGTLDVNTMRINNYIVLKACGKAWI